MNRDMTTETCDIIVIGCGGFGSSVMNHLARRGLRVVGIDRFSPPHQRGSSHGETRVIRKAYFEHPSYVPLLHRAWDLWHELSAEVGESLIERRDLLMSGPDGSVIITGALESARTHQLPVEELSPVEAMRRYPMFRLPESHRVVVESTAGYLWAERCIAANLKLAAKFGAQLRCDEVVERIETNRGIQIQTNRGRYSAAAAVITAGAWTGQLLPEYASLITILRKVLFWYPLTSPLWSDANAPVFLVDALHGQFYGIPSVGGQLAKVGEHTGGHIVKDPLQVDRSVTDADHCGTDQFVDQFLNGLNPEPAQASVCMYSMSPDGHFLLDKHPTKPLVVAAGFSGHGFKFTSVLGEVCADLVTGKTPAVDVEFLSRARFGNDQHCGPRAEG